VQRTDFVKSLLAILGLSFVPEWAQASVVHYRKYYLLQCFVRGFRFYEGPLLIGRMKEGDELQLLREPDNEYDECAIALHWNGKKIGFIPAECNEILSRLLDIGVPELFAEITHLAPEAAAWENVCAVVYVLKEQPAPAPDVPEPAAYLTTLATPAYYSLKGRNDMVTRLYKGQSTAMPNPPVSARCAAERDVYEWLIDHSRDDSIHSYLYDNLNPERDYGVSGRLFVLKRDKLHLLELPDAGIGRIEEAMRQTDIFFADDGYVALSFDEAENLVARISNLGEAMDSAGNSFIELVM
jgi:hypothetical protein